MHGHIVFMIEQKRDRRVFQQLRRQYEENKGEEPVVCGMAVTIVRMKTLQVKGDGGRGYGGDRAILEFRT